MPTMVDSGNGVHCYWIIDQEMPYDIWKPVAMGLKDKTHQLKFKTDDSVVGDGASLVRVPDTFNTKDPKNPKPVTVRNVGRILTLEEFKEFIPPALTHGAVRALPADELTRSLMGDYPSCEFDRVLRKSLSLKEHKARVKEISVDKEGNESIVFKDKIVEACAGCPQIRFAYEHRASLEEPIWFAALAVAKFCTDSEAAIQVISEGHPGYDYHKTIKKIDHILGPTTCVEFQRKNPDGCIGCIHKNDPKMTSPILLGRFTELASPSDNLIENVIHDGFKDPQSVEAPLSYPSPWARPKRGGIVRREFDDPEQAEAMDADMETFVYENDLWVKQLLEDPDGGETVHMIHVQPNGPQGKRVVEFMVPMEEVARCETLQRRLAFNGVHGAVTKATSTLLQSYIRDWVAKLKKEIGFCVARSHYGWHDTSLVIGAREYIPHKQPAYSPPSKATESSADSMKPTGDLALWTQMVDLYNAVGNEVRAFVVFLSFGAPLYKFTGQGSCMIHLTNKDSGVGKSTNQRVAASVWGNPKELMLLKTDTDNARYHMFGVFRHLPIFIDEITNMLPEQISEMAFRISENRGKHRQNSHSNSLRKNTTEWQTMVISSGNNSLYDTLKQHNINIAGEMNRIIELPLSVKDELSIEEASRWYEKVLPNNYGLAGDIYAQYLVDMRDDVEAMVFQCYEDYVQKFNFKQEHRYFRAACAAAFTGARIAKDLGLHNIDVDRVERWAIQQLGGIQSAVKEASSQESVPVLGQFLNAYKRNELVINAGKIMAGGIELSQAPTKEPLGQLAIRVEQDTGRMYIAKSVLMNWCGEHRVHFSVLVDDLEKKGLLMTQSVHKRLAEGTPSPGLPVACICVDLHKTDVMWMELGTGAPSTLQ